jgi:hypothetical protein
MASKILQLTILKELLKQHYNSFCINKHTQSIVTFNELYDEADNFTDKTEPHTLT